MNHPSPPDAAAPPPAAADAALESYRGRMRRARRRYLAALAVIAAVAGLLAAVAWSRGEITHTTLKTIATPPPAVTFQNPASSVRIAWSSTDHTALGTPFAGGTVVTYDDHSVHGRDGRTGAITWTYTRSDRTVCSVAAVDGVAVAVYRLHGDCNEVTTLNAQTGAREWVRTLDEDTHTMRGTPAVQVSDAGVMYVSPSVIYEIDPVTGYDRWLYAPTGCTIHRAVQGSSGVLISQTCAANTTCPDLTLCGPGVQLLLRDGQQGRDTSSGAKNPDRILWDKLGNTDVPVSAGAVVSAIDAAGRLEVYDGSSNPSRRAISLTPAPPASVYAQPDTTASVDDTDNQLLYLAGTAYGLSAAATQLWAARIAGPPTVSSPPVTFGTQVPGEIVAARSTSGGIALLDHTTGAVTRSYPVPVPAGALVYAFGAGFIAAGTTTVCYH